LGVEQKEVDGTFGFGRGFSQGLGRMMDLHSKIGIQVNTVAKIPVTDHQTRVRLIVVYYLNRYRHNSTLY